IGPAAIPSLIAVLGGENPSVRQSAAWALGQIGPAAHAAIPSLIAVLGSKNPSVRQSAAWALGQIGPAAQAAIPSLIAALGSKNPSVRQNAAWALGQIGPAAIPSLIAALGDENPSVRQNAAWALGQIGSVLKEAVSLFRDAVEKERFSESRSLALSIGGMDDDSIHEAFELLVALYEEKRRQTTSNSEFEDWVEKKLSILVASLLYHQAGKLAKRYSEDRVTRTTFLKTLFVSAGLEPEFANQDRNPPEGLELDSPVFSSADQLRGFLEALYKLPTGEFLFNISSANTHINLGLTVERNKAIKSTSLENVLRVLSYLLVFPNNPPGRHRYLMEDIRTDKFDIKTENIRDNQETGVVARLHVGSAALWKDTDIDYFVSVVNWMGWAINQDFETLKPIILQIAKLYEEEGVDLFSASAQDTMNDRKILRLKDQIKKIMGDSIANPTGPVAHPATAGGVGTREAARAGEPVFADDRSQWPSTLPSLSGEAGDEGRAEARAQYLDAAKTAKLLSADPRAFDHAAEILTGAAVVYHQMSGTSLPDPDPPGTDPATGGGVGTRKAEDKPVLRREVLLEAMKVFELDYYSAYVKLQQIDTAYYRSLAWLEIMKATQGREGLAEAKSSAWQINIDHHRFLAWSEIVKALAGFNRIEEAKSLARQIDDAYYYSLAWLEIMKATQGREGPAEAQSFARQIGDVDRRPPAWLEIMKATQGREGLAEAQSFARQIGDFDRRALAWLEIVKALAGFNRIEEAKSLVWQIEEAKSLVWQIDGAYRRFLALVEIAKAERSFFDARYQPYTEEALLPELNQIPKNWGGLERQELRLLLIGHPELMEAENFNPIMNQAGRTTDLTALIQVLSRDPEKTSDYEPWFQGIAELALALYGEDRSDRWHGPMESFNIDGRYRQGDWPYQYQRAIARHQEKLRRPSFTTVESGYRNPVVNIRWGFLAKRLSMEEWTQKTAKDSFFEVGDAHTEESDRRQIPFIALVEGEEIQDNLLGLKEGLLVWRDTQERVLLAPDQARERRLNGETVHLIGFSPGYGRIFYEVQGEIVSSCLYLSLSEPILENWLPQGAALREEAEGKIKKLLDIPDHRVSQDARAYELTQSNGTVCRLSEEALETLARDETWGIPWLKGINGKEKDAFEIYRMLNSVFEMVRLLTTGKTTEAIVYKAILDAPMGVLGHKESIKTVIQLIGEGKATPSGGRLAEDSRAGESGAKTASRWTKPALIAGLMAVLLGAFFYVAYRDHQEKAIIRQVEAAYDARDSFAALPRMIEQNPHLDVMIQNEIDRRAQSREFRRRRDEFLRKVRNLPRQQELFRMTIDPGIPFDSPLRMALGFIKALKQYGIQPDEILRTQAEEPAGRFVITFKSGPNRGKAAWFNARTGQKIFGDAQLELLELKESPGGARQAAGEWRARVAGYARGLLLAVFLQGWAAVAQAPEAWDEQRTPSLAQDLVEELRALSSRFASDAPRRETEAHRIVHFQLPEMGSAALPAAIQMLRDRDAQMRLWATEVLYRLRMRESMEALLNAALNDADQTVRVGAFRGLQPMKAVRTPLAVERLRAVKDSPAAAPSDAREADEVLKAWGEASVDASFEDLTLALDKALERARAGFPPRVYYDRGDLKAPDPLGDLIADELNLPTKDRYLVLSDRMREAIDLLRSSPRFPRSIKGLNLDADVEQGMVLWWIYSPGSFERWEKNGAKRILFEEPQNPLAAGFLPYAVEDAAAVRLKSGYKHVPLAVAAGMAYAVDGWESAKDLCRIFGIRLEERPAWPTRLSLFLSQDIRGQALLMGSALGVWLLAFVTLFVMPAVYFWRRIRHGHLPAETPRSYPGKETGKSSPTPPKDAGTRKALQRDSAEAGGARPAEIQLPGLPDQPYTVQGLMRFSKRANGFVTAIMPLFIWPMGPAAQSAIPALTDALGDKDSLVRRHAARALGIIAPPAQSAVPELTGALEDKDSLVREYAARALGVIGPSAQSAIPALTNALGDKSPSVYKQAVLALGVIGPSAQSATSWLTIASGSESRHRSVYEYADQVSVRTDHLSTEELLSQFKDAVNHGEKAESQFLALSLGSRDEDSIVSALTVLIDQYEAKKKELADDDDSFQEWIHEFLAIVAAALLYRQAEALARRYFEEKGVQETLLQTFFISAGLEPEFANQDRVPPDGLELNSPVFVKAGALRHFLEALYRLPTGEFLFEISSANTHVNLGLTAERRQAIEGTPFEDALRVFSYLLIFPNNPPGRHRYLMEEIETDKFDVKHYDIYRIAETGAVARLHIGTAALWKHTDIDYFVSVVNWLGWAINQDFETLKPIILRMIQLYREEGVDFFSPSTGDVMDEGMVLRLKSQVRKIMADSILAGESPAGIRAAAGLFKKGERISHNSFGPGEVARLDVENNKIGIRFDDAPGSVQTFLFDQIRPQLTLESQADLNPDRMPGDSLVARIQALLDAPSAALSQTRPYFQALANKIEETGSGPLLNEYVRLLARLTVDFPVDYSVEEETELGGTPGWAEFWLWRSLNEGDRQKASDGITRALKERLIPAGRNPIKRLQGEGPAIVVRAPFKSLREIYRMQKAVGRREIGMESFGDVMLVSAEGDEVAVQRLDHFAPNRLHTHHFLLPLSRSKSKDDDANAAKRADENHGSFILGFDEAGGKAELAVFDIPNCAPPDF
ncbi:MAG: HEAT repeat domain-containing protein, partial [Candidatus Omnitrophica bacterium]|nr:HEAT repeat domain-containing protein [Candidatus Omnitrophota bacterium]